MKTQLKILAPLAILLLSGCAEMVKKNYGSNRGGTVRYTTGWFLDEKNRAKAMEEMQSYCRPGRAQLVSEKIESEFTGNSYSNSRTGLPGVSGHVRR